MVVDLTANPILALYMSGILLMMSGAVYTLAVFMYRRKKLMQIMYKEI